MLKCNYMDINGRVDMETNELLLFADAQESLPLYLAFREMMMQWFPDVEIKAAKTQITFKARYGFAFVSLPRRKRDRGGVMVSFGLPERVESPRIWQVSEPYPNRWTHHAVVTCREEIDEELKGWIHAAYSFALIK